MKTAIRALIIAIAVGTAHAQVIPYEWDLDGTTDVASASIPEIIPVPGGYRMYFRAGSGIQSAFSSNGISFTLASAPALLDWSTDGAAVMVSDPSVIPLPGGGYRMYFKGANGAGGIGESTHKIYSAISSDGITFTLESGIRIDSETSGDGSWASVPDAVLLPDGSVRLYYVSGGPDAYESIVSAHSADGITFEREGLVMTNYVDPDVHRFPSGDYVMMAVDRSISADKRVALFTSTDGRTFEELSIITTNHGTIIDPSMVLLRDGVILFYYWKPSDTPSFIRYGAGIPQHTLRYRVIAGGSISGSATQHVSQYESGSPVFAVPESGVHFDMWSDGRRHNPRADEHVMRSIDVIARFRTDGGVPIEWYLAYGLYPSADASWASLDLMDPDGDGYSNRREYLRASSPIVSD